MFSKVIAGSILALSSTLVSSAGVQFAGINIAGFDFGCVTDGHCTLSSIDPPLGGNGGDGPSQMTHFAQVDKFNIFRLPVAWQYLQDTPGAPLNTGNLGTYDQLMQACLKTGAHCILDIHNYARWDGKIIGQSGGPTNDQFADVWSQLATKYATEGKVVMGLMNEPHDLPDIGAWATAVQGAVTAIRKAGAKDQMILLPGTGYTSAGGFVSDGSAAALSSVKDSDGTTSKLIFDVHNYFDADGSGTTAECTSNKISDGFQPLVSYLKANNRQALVSELGGGSSTSSCLSNICEALDFLNENSDVYLGWVGWAAGSFDQSYVLSLRPTAAGSDVELVKQCFAGKFGGGGGAGAGPKVASASGSNGSGTNPSSTTPSGANPKPSGTSDSGSNPSGTNPSGTTPSANLNPSSTNDSGANPIGTNPSGTNPSGTNPSGTNPNGANPGPSGTIDSGSKASGTNSNADSSESNSGQGAGAGTSGSTGIPKAPIAAPAVQGATGSGVQPPFPLRNGTATQLLGTGKGAQQQGTGPQQQSTDSHEQQGKTTGAQQQKQQQQQPGDKGTGPQQQKQQQQQPGDKGTGPQQQQDTGPQQHSTNSHEQQGKTTGAQQQKQQQQQPGDKGTGSQQQHGTDTQQQQGKDTGSKQQQQEGKGTGSQQQQQQQGTPTQQQHGQGSSLHHKQQHHHYGKGNGTCKASPSGSATAGRKKSSRDARKIAYAKNLA